MTSYFLLLAGFTSFMSKRCFSHFCAIGPAGIFASSFTVGLRYGATIPARIETGIEMNPKKTTRATITAKGLR